MNLLSLHQTRIVLLQLSIYLRRINTLTGEKIIFLL